MTGTRMKRWIACIVTATLALTASILLLSPAGSGIVGSIRGGGATRSAAEAINAASTLPLPLLTPHAEARDALRHDAHYEYINNFMSTDYFADDHFLSFTGFPNDDSPSCLMRISWTAGDYDVFGIGIGEDMRRAAAILEEQGYGPAEDSFIMGDIRITPSGGDTVEEIRIYITSPYTSGNLY